MAVLPKVMLLGDSIRMGYQPLVAELLKGKAEVIGPAENGQYSLYTVSAIKRWINDLGRPDIVHWNNGIHDCGYNPVRYPKQIPLKVYCRSLREMIAQLKMRTSSQVIWASTTPVCPNRGFINDLWLWESEDIDLYNAAARRIMKEHKIPINDLNGIVRNRMAEYMADDQLHLSKNGTRACAEAVVRAVEAYLPAN